MTTYFDDKTSLGRVQSLDFFKVRTQTLAPKHLFHYTSSEGLLGILSSKSVWMSDSQSLNDATELSYFKGVVENTAYNFCNNHASKNLPQAKKDLIDILRQHSKATTGGIFLASFSEHRDQLSQWRAYTGGATGYSLGLPGDKLIEKAGQQNFIFCKCSYDRKEATQAAAQLINYFTDKFLNGDKLLLGSELNSLMR